MNLYNYVKSVHNIWRGDNIWLALWIDGLKGEPFADPYLLNFGCDIFVLTLVTSCRS